MQLPGGFKERMTALGLADAIPVMEEGSPEVSIRINPAKAHSVMPEVAADGSEKVAWWSGGEYLPVRPSFVLDPEWHQGRYYVQEASSMVHAAIVTALYPEGSRGVVALDACAAPGGKTTAVIDALPAGSFVVANEYVPARAAILKENIVKWGCPRTIVTRGDSGSLARLREEFDLVIADVPCSGEGMMRKESEAVNQWSPALVADCARLQWEIVSNVWHALRPGGVMIYSTCTFNREENEMMIHRIMDELGAEPVIVDGLDFKGVTPALGADGAPDPEIFAMRFIPGRTRGEGLFVSVLRKPGNAGNDSAGRENRPCKGGMKYGGKGKNAADASVKRSLLSQLKNPDGYELIFSEDRVTAFPKEHLRLLEMCRRHVSVIHEGVPLATVKGRDFVPSHALIMSTALNREAFPGCEVDRETALRYLHGESPVLPPDVPRGYVLLTYRGEPLGAVKNLGSRSNSLYPQGWRIKNHNI